MVCLEWIVAVAEMEPERDVELEAETSGLKK